MTDTSALRAEFEKFWEAERQRTWDAAGMPSHRGSTPSEAWGSSFKEHTWTGFQAAHSIRNAEVERLKDEIERYRNGNTAALEALMMMAWQYMGTTDQKDVVRHSFMSAGEDCCDVLEAAGVATPTGDGCKLDWPALEARKPKQQTWAEAVNDLDVSDEEKARLLAFENDAAALSASARTTGGEG